LDPARYLLCNAIILYDKREPVGQIRWIKTRKRINAPSPDRVVRHPRAGGPKRILPDYPLHYLNQRSQIPGLLGITIYSFLIESLCLNDALFGKLDEYSCQKAEEEALQKYAFHGNRRPIHCSLIGSINSRIAQCKRAQPWA